MEEQPLIVYRNVDINQQELGILNDVNFELRRGEFVYIIGKVGSGKSTFLKTIYGELPACNGEPQVLEYNMREIRPGQIPALRRRLGIVFQDFQLLTDRTVEENLKFVLRATGWKDRTAIQNRIHEVLTQVGMENKGYKMPNELSGGEQQMLAVGRALMARPSLIMMDEPSLGLAPLVVKSIFDIIKEINRNGITVLLIEQNANMALQAAHTAYVLETGKITMSGKGSELIQDERIKEAYLGKSKTK